MKTRTGNWVVPALAAALFLGGVGAAERVSAQSSVQSLARPHVEYQVLAFNDLGMHCYDTDFSIFSLLPPFNVVHAQVIAKGPKPRLCDDAEIACFYSAARDPSGSINRTSSGKTNFWQYAGALYGADLDRDEGLLGARMPGLANHRQPMAYDPVMKWSSAIGIPITNLGDHLRMNPYSLMQIDALGRRTRESSLDIVVPASSEMGCVACHVTGQDGASDWHAATYQVAFSANPNPILQYRENILLLHDGIEGTNLFQNRPVLCAGCHYSKALDLAGTGPSQQQQGHVYLSRAVHGHHGRTLGHQTPGVNNTDPPILPEAGAQSCYNCHPGTVTNCLRGVMSAARIVCQDCHGGMLQLAGQFAEACGQSPRRPWVDLPKCQSCHTGDAVDHLGDSFHAGQTYCDWDATATPILALNQRFAENEGTLYRFSTGHGGVACSGCHGSPHAEWPSHGTSPNDNIAATQLQGHIGPIIECHTCHTGTLPLTLNGPHGLHSVNDMAWVNGHTTLAKTPAGQSACAACHGSSLQGTTLSRAATARKFVVPDLTHRGRKMTVRVKSGTPVGCGLCHAVPAP